MEGRRRSARLRQNPVGFQHTRDSSSSSSSSEDNFDSEGFAVPSSPPIRTGRKTTDRSTGYRPRVVEQGNLEITNSELFETIRVGNKKLEQEALNWSFLAIEDRHGAVVQLMNLIIEAAGFPPDLLDPAEAEDRTPDEVMDEILAMIDSRGYDVGLRYPLYNKMKKFKTFGENLLRFLRHIITESERSALTTPVGPKRGREETMLARLHNWMVPLTLSKVRCLRHASSAVMLGIADGVLSSLKNVEKDILKFTQQLEAEKASTRTDSTVMSSITAKLAGLRRAEQEFTRAADLTFTTIVAQRWRDVSDAIRMTLFASICRWNREWPDKILFRFRGSMQVAFQDPCTDIRLEVVTLLQELLSQTPQPVALGDKEVAASFRPLIIERLFDEDVRIRKLAVQCVTIMVRDDMLHEEDIGMIIDLIFTDESIEVREELASFVDTALFSTSIIRDAPEKLIHSAEHQEMEAVEIRSFLEFLLEFGTSFLRRTESAVQAFWNKAPSLRNIPLIMDFLTLEQVDANSAPLDDNSRLPLLCVMHASLKSQYADYHRFREDDQSVAAIRCRRSLETDTLAFFSRLPGLLKSSQTNDEELQTAICCAFVAAGSANIVADRLNSHEVSECLTQTFARQSHDAVLRSSVATLAELHRKLADSGTPHPEFAKALLTVAEITRTEFVGSIGEWKKAKTDKTTAALMVALKRVEAVVQTSHPVVCEDDSIKTELLNIIRLRARNPAEVPRAIPLLCSASLVVMYLVQWSRIRRRYATHEPTTTSAPMSPSEPEPDKEPRSESSKRRRESSDRHSRKRMRGTGDFYRPDSFDDWATDGAAPNEEVLSVLMERAFAFRGRLMESFMGVLGDQEPPIGFDAATAILQIAQLDGYVEVLLSSEAAAAMQNESSDVTLRLYRFQFNEEQSQKLGAFYDRLVEVSRVAEVDKIPSGLYAVETERPFPACDATFFITDFKNQIAYKETEEHTRRRLAWMAETFADLVLIVKNQSCWEALGGRLIAHAAVCSRVAIHEAAETMMKELTKSAVEPVLRLRWQVLEGALLKFCGGEDVAELRKVVTRGFKPGCFSGPEFEAFVNRVVAKGHARTLTQVLPESVLHTSYCKRLLESSQ